MWDDLIEGFTATYSCKIGHELIGDETRTCENRQWTGTEPTCIEKLCPPLPLPDGGSVDVSGLTHGSTVAYTCNAGYRLIGDEIRECVYGDWTGVAPNCTCMSMAHYFHVKCPKGVIET